MATLRFTFTTTPSADAEDVFAMQVWSIPAWVVDSNTWYSAVDLIAAGTLLGTSEWIGDIDGVPDPLDISLSGTASYMLVTNNLFTDEWPADPPAGDDWIEASGIELIDEADSFFPTYRLTTSSHANYATMQTGANLAETTAQKAGQGQIDSVYYGYQLLLSFDFAEPVVIEEGATICPAPEPLPHRISLEDVKKFNPSLRHKLQDNFDSVERQLLALEPVAPDSDPHR